MMVIAVMMIPMYGCMYVSNVCMRTMMIILLTVYDGDDHRVSSDDNV